jgi:hypothetical protein
MFLDGRRPLEGLEFGESDVSMPRLWWREHLTVMDEAAATITRLEGELEKHQLVGGTILSRKDLAALIDRAEAAEAENARLREALTKIERLVDHPGGFSDGLRYAAGIARDGLTQSQET